MSSDNSQTGVVTPTELVQTLAGTGLRYVAASEGDLPEIVGLYIAGDPDARNQAMDFLDETTAVRSRGELIPLVFEDATQGTTHYRVPLYVSETHRDLDAVDVGSGVQNLRAGLVGEWPSTSAPREIITARRLTENLVETGAVSVEVLRSELKFGKPSMDVIVGLDAETLYETVGEYQLVVVGDKAYPLDIRPVEGGPKGETKHIGLYYGEKIIGLRPKSIDMGMSDLQAWLWNEVWD